VRVLLDLYTDDGRMRGWLRGAQEGDPVAFDGVLELVAALERLDSDAHRDVESSAQGEGQR
jgi:hypothetical protein